VLKVKCDVGIEIVKPGSLMVQRKVIEVKVDDGSALNRKDFSPVHLPWYFSLCWIVVRFIVLWQDSYLSQIAESRPTPSCSTLDL
jgi:hypothetical protein